MEHNVELSDHFALVVEVYTTFLSNLGWFSVEQVTTDEWLLGFKKIEKIKETSFQKILIIFTKKQFFEKIWKFSKSKIFLGQKIFFEKSYGDLISDDFEHFCKKKFVWKNIFFRNFSKSGSKICLIS